MGGQADSLAGWLRQPWQTAAGHVARSPAARETAFRLKHNVGLSPPIRHKQQIYR